MRSACFSVLILIAVLSPAVLMTGCTPVQPAPTEAYHQAQELLSRYGWSTTGRQATYQVTLPDSFEHHPGEFPIPIYWAYNNELSKAIGLDLSPYLGQRVKATVYELDEDSPQGQGLEAIRFEKIWPEEKVQGFLGTIGVETLDGREVAVFTDKESGQRYVPFRSLGSDFTPDFYDYGSDMHKQVFLTGVVRPDQTFAGLPVIEEAGMRTGSEVDATTSAAQLPLETPQVIDESRMMRLKGRAIIDRVELAYYAPPGALGERPVAETRSEFSFVQPVWVFHGHSEDGRATFRAYVQAVADEYLQ